MQSSSFAYLFRMKYVQRWNLMRNSIPENILEHSVQVALVAHLLGVIRNKRFEGNVSLGRLTLFSLYHDCAEVVTTDLPTPIKNLTPDLHDSFKEIEQLVSMRFYSMIPKDLRSDYEWIFIPDENDKELHALCKAADLICAFYKCSEWTFHSLKIKSFNLFQKKQRCTRQVMRLPPCFLPTFCLFLTSFPHAAFGTEEAASDSKHKPHAPYAYAVKAPLRPDAVIYLAGPLFTEAEKAWWRAAIPQIQKALPQARLIWPGELFAPDEVRAWGDQAKHEIFARCRDHAAKADMIIALLDGTMVDDGTAWELGYFYALQRGPIYGVRTDFRNSGDTPSSQANAMIEGSCNAIYPSIRALLDDLQ